MGNCVGGKGAKKDPKLLTDDEVKILRENTSLSISQINTLHANFLKECPTGKLTKKDFIKLFKEVHPSENKKEKADKFCEYVFKTIDKDNQGFITFQDFVLCFSLTSYGDFKQKCEFAFKLYDLDKDGKISKKEMTQVLEALYDLSGITDRKGDNAPAKKVDDIMKKINQDGPVVSAEPASNASTLSNKDSKKKDSKSSKSADSKDNKKDAKKDAKKEKPSKETTAKTSGAAKPKDYITKEQFIEACSTDDSIKKLFLDSIYANTDDTSAGVNIKAPSVNIKGPSFNANAPSVNIKAPSVNVKAPSVNVQAPSACFIQAPSLSAQAPSLSAQAPSVQIDSNTISVNPVKLSVNSKTTVTTTDSDAKSNDDSVVHTSHTTVDVNNNTDSSPVVSSTLISAAAPKGDIVVSHQDDELVKVKLPELHVEPMVILAPEHETKAEVNVAHDKPVESHESSSAIHVVAVNEHADENKPNSESNNSEEKKSS